MGRQLEVGRIVGPHDQLNPRELARLAGICCLAGHYVGGKERHDFAGDESRQAEGCKVAQVRVNARRERRPLLGQNTILSNGKG